MVVTQPLRYALPNYMNPKDAQLHSHDEQVSLAHSKLKIHEHFKIFRDYVEHEDGLINNRLTWNTTIQAFLFTVYGFSVQKLADIHAKPGTQDITEKALFWLTFVLPVFGGGISYLTYKGVMAAQRAIENLEQQWDEIVKCEYPTENPGLLPKLIGGGSTKVAAFHDELHASELKRHHVVVNWGFTAPKRFPRFFEVAWALLFLYDLIPWVRYFCSLWKP